MQIGELAHRVSLSSKTIRYYEAVGLLPNPQRTSVGYRQYDETAVMRLAFIQRAKLIGLSLTDIRELLAIHERGGQLCARVLALIDDELNDIDRRIEALHALRVDLAALRAEWSDVARRQTESAIVCPIIEDQTTVRARHSLDLPVGWKV